MEGDTPIKRKTFLEMSEIEQIAFTEALRERRLSPINTFKEIQEANKQKKLSKIQEKLDKEIVMFEKCLARVDKYLDELETRANKLKMYKIQLEID